MSSLKQIDKIKLEKFFEMGGGYVCDFSDRTFGDFVLESTGIDIYTPEYTEQGTSKAKRLRTFWKKESNHLTARLIKDLLDYWRLQKVAFQKSYSQEDKLLFHECVRVVDKLRAEIQGEEIEGIKPNSSDKDFHALGISIQESIQKDNPGEALDRLHTFVTKYLRELCDRHAITYDRNKPLHSLLGEYLKTLDRKNLIESEMSKRILKSSISILEAFSSVRNEQSYAHDNPILNKNESILIFKNISNTLRFLELIEQQVAEQKEKHNKSIKWDDFEFDEGEAVRAGDWYMQQQLDESRGK